VPAAVPNRRFPPQFLFLILLLLPRAGFGAPGGDPPGPGSPVPGPPGGRAAPGPPAVVLDTVEVSAPRLGAAERLLRAPGFSTALRAGAGAPFAGGAAALLQEAPGLHVSTSGGPGAFATLSIRGSSAQQVAYLLDGVPLHWSEFGAVNLNDLPLESLARIEVHRGHVPFALGVEAPGGAVNLISDTSAAVRTRVRLESGSYGDREQSAGASVAKGAWRAHATLTHATYRGDFTYFNDNRTPFDPADDRTETRINNDLERWRGSLLVSGARAGLGLYGFRDDQGLPGLGHFQAVHPRFQSSGEAAHLWWSAAGDPALGLPGGRPAARLGLEGFYTRGDQHFRDPQGELGMGYLESRSTDQTLGARLSGGLPAGAGLELAATLQQSVEHWAPEFITPRRAARGANRAAGSAGLELAHRGERLEASGGVRAEWWVDRGSSIDRRGVPTPPLPGSLESRGLPAAGLSVAVLPGLWLKGDAGVYQRLPSMAERFGVEGSQVGNPALQPERGTSQDLGVAWRAGRGGLRAELEAARFWGTATDVIVPVQNSQRTTIPQNAGRAQISGEELRARAGLGALETQASATWLAALDASDNPTHAGKQLPGRPEFELFAEASLHVPLVQPALRVQHVGRNWLEQAHGPGSLVASRTLWAAGLTAPLERLGLALHLDLDNLTDERASDLDGYPLPGRTLRLGLAWTRSGRRPAAP